LIETEDTITTYHAVTEDNKVFTLVAETIFEDEVSLVVLEDEKELVTLACKW